MERPLCTGKSQALFLLDVNITKGELTQNRLLISLLFLYIETIKYFIF